MSLIINNLHFQYTSARPLLQGLNLEVAQGEKHGILGENGAGKTTLFRLLAGWIPRTDRSNLRLNEASLLPQDVAFLEAEPVFYPYMTGMEHLRFIHDDPALIQRWNQVFHLPLEQYAQEYSTGMRKKLALIAVLLQQRPVLILDEPFNGVDWESNEKIMALLQQGIAQNAATLISSHILNTLTRVCDRISVLKEGILFQTFARHEFAELEHSSKQRLEVDLSDLRHPH
jgi:ABC-2 type transport system ATP-binding protein